MQQTLRVDTAGVQAMAARWGASVERLNATVAPAERGLSCQISAAAVNAAQIDVTAFTAGLAMQMGAHVAGVAKANSCYLTEEADSATKLGAVAHPVTSV
ncbi:hypothetical protein QRB36_17665 [Mycobacterium marseillense]|uniref:hypothetical protein n=1 Tax=Mycobacterium avium complex (MAC) TaxID=120793 RepID=UPI001F15A951|nr:MULTISPECIES: hypothetical protein [Mycobacterium avium complex (MAC)]MDM3975997.1 hypothetical protein [Mycobacterium marseillense]